MHEEEQREMNDEPANENERFLLNEKVEIIKMIREKRIEEAIALIEKTIPTFLEESHMMAFFKAHIFLRMMKEGNCLLR